VSPLVESRVVAEFVESTGCKNMLYIGFHYERGKERFEQFKSSLQGSVKLTYFERDTVSETITQLQTYDGVFISGGMEQELLNAFDEDGFRKPLVEWLQSGHAKVYVGSSAGVQVLGKKYFSWESEVADGEVIRDNGLGIFENTLFEVHTTERERRPLVDKAIKDEDTIDYVFGIDEGSAIILRCHQ